MIRVGRRKSKAHEIAPAGVTVRVLGKSRNLSVAEVLRVQVLGPLTSDGGAGLRIFFRGPHWEEYVDFYTLFGRGEVLAELERAGFNVVEKSS